MINLNGSFHLLQFNKKNLQQFSAAYMRKEKSLKFYQLESEFENLPGCDFIIFSS